MGKAREKLEWFGSKGKDGAETVKIRSKYYQCGWYDSLCTGCEDGTECGKINKNGKICGCQSPSEGTGKTSYNDCSLADAGKPCSKCDDGTSCGELGKTDKYCSCLDKIKDSDRYLNCILDPAKRDCDGCQPDVKCGEKNDDGDSCTCYGPIDNGKYKACLFWNDSPLEPLMTQ